MSTTEDERPTAPDEDGRANAEALLANSVDRSALRGLSHPLRVRIFDLLTTSGPLTASRLAELVGESSGSTSYHLRQLARHGFVREVEGKGTARERWWDASRNRFIIAPEADDNAATRLAKGLVNAEFERTRQEKIWALMRAMQEYPEKHAEWQRASTMSTTSTWATPEQLEQVINRVMAVLEAELAPLRNQRDVPGTQPVHIHFNAFPLLDVPELPERD